MSGDVERGRRGRNRGRRGRGRHHGSRVLVLRFAASGLVLAEYAGDGKRRVRCRGRLNRGGRRFSSATPVAGRCGRGHGRRGGGAAAVTARRRVLVVVVVAGHVNARRRFGHDDETAAASVATGTVVIRDSSRLRRPKKKKKKTANTLATNAQTDDTNGRSRSKIRPRDRTVSD